MRKKEEPVKRLNCYLPIEIYYQLNDICNKISRQRGKRCYKTELMTLALTAFVLSFNANLEEKDSDQEQKEDI